jgi:redox-sensitive bicupin YhaK (pirin superfamily)
VPTFSDMFYVDLRLQPNARFALPLDPVERAAYVVEGSVAVAGDGDRRHASQTLVVFAPGAEVVLTAVDGPARVMLLGGEPIDGPRHLWWNFVSSSAERIEQAKADWRAGRFPKVPDETEFIPLPEGPPPAPPVTYP